LIAGRDGYGVLSHKDGLRRSRRYLCVTAGRTGGDEQNKELSAAQPFFHSPYRMARGCLAPLAILRQLEVNPVTAYLLQKIQRVAYATCKVRVITPSVPSTLKIDGPMALKK
jgi:hypothetical protein